MGTSHGDEPRKWATRVDRQTRGSAHVLDFAEPRRILIVDDNPDDRTLAEHELRREFGGLELISVGGAAALDRALSAEPCDVVVTDYNLGWTNGLVVLRRVRTVWPGCPVVMFTGTGSEEIAVEAMRAGLADYVIKTTAHFARLPVAVRGAWTNARRQRQLREAELRYTSLFERNRCPMFLVDPATRRVFDANPAGAEASGYGREQLRGMPVDQLMGGAPGAITAIVEALLADRPEVLFGRTRSASGETSDVEIYGGRITVAERDLIYAIVHDVTERRQAEAERDRLYREVREREEMIELLLGRTIRAQESERERVCLDVHDSVVQPMAGAVNYMEALDRQPELSGESRSYLVEARELLRSANREAREIIATLRPAALDILGLVEALREQLLALAARAGLDVEYIAEPRRYSGAVETTLYRIIQEATSNVEKHARARRLRVEISSAADRVMARVTDDGVGFDPLAERSSPLGGGVGLIGMRMRAELLGGSVDLTSGDGQGTAVTVSLPVRGDVDDAMS